MIDKCEVCVNKSIETCHDCYNKEDFEIITYDYLDKRVEIYHKYIKNLEKQKDILKNYLEENNDGEFDKKA